MTQKETQQERPATRSEATEWYKDGYIDEDELEDLLETAIKHYGGDGDRELMAKVSGIGMAEDEAEEINEFQKIANETSTPSFDAIGLIQLIPVVALIVCAIIVITPMKIIIGKPLSAEEKIVAAIGIGFLITFGVGLTLF